MRKYILFFLTVILLGFLAFGCATTDSDDIATQNKREADASGLDSHTIGVATYNIRDAQVMMFKEYLDHYIGDCFPDVTFLYSESISGSEELMDFLELCAENGAEGVMVFGSYDLQKEVAFCAEHDMYMIRPSATSSDADFEAVASNPYYIGEIGPGSELEYEAGADMTRTMAEDGKTYLILSGGAAEDNEMHRLRTLGMLETLQEIYGTELEQTAEELAVTEETVTVEAGGLKVTVFPGYLEREENAAAAAKMIEDGDYTTVLSSVPVSPLMETLDTVKVECGTIDCFSEDNSYGFQDGTISYVAGKYQSEIGPGFAALYNAITGNADAFRENGRAFRLKQGFWTAKSSEEYEKMYSLARSISVNAYNYEDLYSVIKSMTPEADFDSLKTLAESFSYEACMERRGLH
ncbi:hypothetical protein B5E53_00200 [Eubacterium sp. An11]|uniref:hypothetical protein n=1 Tax=Eubacterium sp. An11 TaxID=1965542 RepID=UPI000B39A4FD|nr:hypothetical protein [Eubacterium sp. An11]OUQ70087.1 hypothetical protein B5E53_00200 [Eubacterium sp. An11]